MLLLNSKVNLVSVYRPSFFSTQAKNCSNTVIIGRDYQFPQNVSRRRERWSRVRHSIVRKTHWCFCHLLPYHCERPFIAPEVGEPHPVNKILQAASCLGVRRGYRCHWHLHNSATEKKSRSRHAIWVKCLESLERGTRHSWKWSSSWTCWNPLLCERWCV